MSWLEKAARRAAGVETRSHLVAEAPDPGARYSRSVLLRKAGVAAATVFLTGAAKPAGARGLSCGPAPGVPGTYKSYAGCVKYGAGKEFRARILGCRREEADLLRLAAGARKKWMDWGESNPWLTDEAIVSRELACTQEAYSNWARAADNCASRCPIPKRKQVKSPTQPVPTPTRPPNVPAGIPPSGYDACLNCMSVGGVCCPADSFPGFICTNPTRQCAG